MNDFLSWVEGVRERQEVERHFSMYQTSLLFNAIRNQWGDNGIISVDELMGKNTEEKEETVSLSDFASKEQFDEYMRQRRREQ